MRGVITIWKKELRIYLTSARWYALAALIFSLTSLWFWLATLQAGGEASISGITALLSFLLMVVTPIFTMRLIAEEANRGTLELLLTSPIREWQIVLGKYLGALSAYGGIFVLTLVYPLILFRFGEPDGGPMIAQYVGMIGLCSTSIAVGMFASSVTDSQVLAAVFGYILLLGFWIASFIGEALPGVWGDVGEAVSLLKHQEKFSRGVIDAVDVFYYLAFTAIFLVLTQRFIEARRWAA